MMFLMRPIRCAQACAATGDKAHATNDAFGESPFAPRKLRYRQLATGFTLVELLVVMMLLLMLAAVGLPTVKKLIKDQKTAQTARNIVAYIEGARAKAIATGQPVGVQFERVGSTDYVSRSYAIRMRMLTSVPPYSGESETSTATLFHSPYDPSNPSGIANAALFDATDNPLLLLSAQQGGGPDAPIRIGARFEVDGGRSVRINSIAIAQDPDPRLASEPPSPGNRTAIKITFDPRDVISSRLYPGSSYGHPSGLVTVLDTTSVRFRIHRLPTPSNVDQLDLLRGMAVDLNFSGIGPDGVHFAPHVIDGTLATDTSTPFQPVTIMFAPDGSVDVAVWGLGNLDERPAGNLFFLLGKADQVALSPTPAEWFLNDDQGTSNIMDLESIWIAVNPNNGHVYAAPVASVSATSSLSTAVLQSREFALQADTLNSN